MVPRMMGGAGEDEGSGQDEELGCEVLIQALHWLCLDHVKRR